jgi:hypothetical protein
LREKHRLRIFENKVLRKIFRAKWDEVTGEWRRLHNEDLYEMYSLPICYSGYQSKRMAWTGDIASIGNRRGAYRVLVRKSEGKRPLGKSRC